MAVVPYRVVRNVIVDSALRLAGETVEGETSRVRNLLDAGDLAAISAKGSKGGKGGNGGQAVPAESEGGDAATDPGAATDGQDGDGTGAAPSLPLEG